MIISTAITFATQHPAFNQFMVNHRTNPDLAEKVTAQVVPGPDRNFGYLLIFLDFGKPGPGLGEVKIQIRLERRTGNLIFDGVGLVTNPSQKSFDSTLETPVINLFDR